MVGIIKLIILTQKIFLFSDSRQMVILYHFVILITPQVKNQTQ